MSLLYGEGRKAFIRLQEQILKSTDDESLFANSYPSTQNLVTYSFSASEALAQSPVWFSECGLIKVFQCESRELPAEPVPAALTNKGLRVRLPLQRYINDRGKQTYFALLNCKVGEDNLARLAVPLIRLPKSRDQFCRDDIYSLHVLRPACDGLGSASVTKYRGGKPLGPDSKRCHLLNSSVPFRTSSFICARHY